MNQERLDNKTCSKNPRILAIVNQKGGVGKTTTAVNLATAMTACDLRVLLIDLDPQGNASTGLGISRAARVNDTYSVLIGACAIIDAVKRSTIPGLTVIPSSEDLSGAEIELVGTHLREYRLKEALAEFVESGECGYDYVIVDCPPSLGLLTLNALVAANSVLVPLQCEFYALEGLSMLLKTIEKVQIRFNPALGIQGVVLTMFDKRNNLSEQVAADVRKHMGNKVYRTVIPRNVKVSEAPSHGLPVLVYDLKCAGSKAYVHLAGEVINQERSWAA